MCTYALVHVHAHVHTHICTCMQACAKLTRTPCKVGSYNPKVICCPQKSMLRPPGRTLTVRTSPKSVQPHGENMEIYPFYSLPPGDLVISLNKIIAYLCTGAWLSDTSESYIIRGGDPGGHMTSRRRRIDADVTS